MATVERPSTKASPTPQYESFVDKQLASARRRLRSLELAVWSLGLASAVLAYGLAVSLVDRLWDLATAIRLTAWCFFTTGIAVGLAFAVRQLAFRIVNPQFLAHQLEQTVPGAKNSIINWLDLRSEPLAPVIRGSLGRRAAKDVSQADAEEALSAQPVLWLTGVIGLLVLLQLGWLVAAPTQALSLLKRAFLPFDMAPIAARTELTLLAPAGGDVAIAANKPVVIRVQVQGYVPAINQKDSLKLHFRYHQNEPFEERALLREVDGIWTTTVLADQVRNGFWYKITGGDARLPEGREYRVDVQAIPQVLRYEAIFHYRPYLFHKDRTLVFTKNVRPSIKDLRGTAVTLTLATNRVLKQCVLELTTAASKTELTGEPVPGDAEAWRFQWVLDQSGVFRIQFQSKEGEENVDRQPCTLEVIPDRAPEVVMTKPAKDLTLPANGTLVVDGQATDDFGVKAMQMMLKVIKAPTMPELQPKPYRPEKSFQLPSGKYPLRLDYSDLVALSSLKTIDGKVFPLAAGMELEYWIEARDNCDYPDKAGNLGQSKRYKLTIDPPEVNQNKAAQGQNSAQEHVQENQKKQDRAHDQQKMMDQAQNDKDGSGGGSGQDGQPQPKNDDQTKQGEKGSSGAGSGQDGQPQPNDKELKDQADKVKDAIDQANAKSNSQGADPKQGDPKDKGQPKNSSGDPKANPPDGKEGANKKDGDQGKDIKQAKDNQAGQKDKGAEKQDTDKTGKASDGEGKDGAPTKQPPPKDAQATTDKTGGANGNDPSKREPPAGAKADPKDASQGKGEGKPLDQRDATLDEIDKLREQLKQPEQRERAEKALEKIGEQARDPDVQKAAEKAIEEARAQPGQQKDNGSKAGTAADVAKDKAPGSSADPQGGAAGKEPPPKAEAGKSKAESGPGKTADKGKSDPGKTTGGKTGSSNQAAAGKDDLIKGSPVDEAASHRAADLQLENLKTKVDKLRDQLTPEVMKKLNWTDKEREEFLDRMLRDAMTRQQQQQKPGAKLPPPGSLESLLPIAGPRNLKAGPNNDPGSVIDDRRAPPEVHEAQKIFQGKG